MSATTFMKLDEFLDVIVDKTFPIPKLWQPKIKRNSLK